jgi:hypothetical protein
VCGAPFDLEATPNLRARIEEEPVKLYFLCGKMAAGKSTFAKRLARAKNAVLLVQDELLGALYPGEIQSIVVSSTC